ncbi:MAG: aminotransferase class I/II-fold pyridoxal phosphate-dependent enzyme, partial [Victivallales bacterium]|nr:aminotransferase class I/II-fold pyridoxal phosphate-dependent enzyme [Victivallales bacterium]
GAEVDVNIYNERRLAMAKVLDDAGIDYTMPGGAFYFFPRSPLADDVEFCRLLMAHNVLAVPGSGFGCPGFFRLAFCVDRKIIERSAAAFRRTMDGLNQSR